MITILSTQKFLHLILQLNFNASSNNRTLSLATQNFPSNLHMASPLATSLLLNTLSPLPIFPVLMFMQTLYAPVLLTNFVLDVTRVPSHAMYSNRRLDLFVHLLSKSTSKRVLWVSPSNIVYADISPTRAEPNSPSTMKLTRMISPHAGGKQPMSPK